MIIHFTMRTFKQKIWRPSRDADIMKKRKLRFAEDLTHLERESRKKLRPQVEKARKAGKKATWKGPDAIIDGMIIKAG